MQGIKQIINIDILKFIFSACVGAISAYLGLYHSINENSYEIKKQIEWRKDADKNLEKISDELTEIKVVLEGIKTEIRINRYGNK